MPIPPDSRSPGDAGHIGDHNDIADELTTLAGAITTETSRAGTAEGLAAQKSANLSDLGSAATARTNLGLGSAATQASSAFDAAGTSAAETARAQAAETLALPLAGGAMTGAIAMGSHKVTGLSNGTTGSDAAAFGQIPAALPPNGSASGDLGGTYPSPTVAATHLASPLPVTQGGTASGSRVWAGLLTPAAVKTSAYTAAAGDYVPVDTTIGAVTITLPAAPADLAVVGVKHVIQGGTNTVTVTCGGADVYNKAGGATTLTLTLLAQGVLLQYKATGGIWYIVADDLALAQLDGRYAQRASNLSDLASASTARTNLGLGAGATAAIDATAGDIAALGTQAAGATGKLADAGHVHPPTGVAQTANNLSDLASMATARANLGVPVVNAVTDFGCVGDGTTDNATTLQNFFTALATGGSKAGQKGYLPPGTYKTSAAIAGGTHTQVQGGGKYNTTIKGTGANTDVLQFSSGGNMLGVELSDFSIAGPYRADTTGTSTTNTSTTVGDTHAVAGDVGQPITGTGIPASTTISSVTPGTGYVISQAATATGTPALKVGAGTGVGLNLNNWLDTCSLKRMIIQGCGSHGILLQNSYLVSFEHIWHYNNGGDGLHGATSLNAVKWDNCEFYGNAGSGADLSGLAGSIITACDFETNGQHGLKLTNAYSLTVEANDFENNGTSSAGTTYAGIYVASNSVYSGPRILGNNLTGTSATTANGIEVAAAVTGTYIEGNSFNNFALNDILINSGATGAVIAPNNVHEAGSGAFITDNGTATTYLGVPEAGTVPSDVNAKAWNYDPALSPASGTLPVYANYTAGVVFLARVEVRKPLLVSKIGAYWSAPSGGSPVNAYFGLYSSSGSRIDLTSDVSATASGLKAFSLGSSHNLAAGTYYVAYVIGTQGTTSGGPWYPNTSGQINYSVFTGAFGDLAVSASKYRWAHQLTSQTSLPSSLTLSSNSGASVLPFWAVLL